MNHSTFIQKAIDLSKESSAKGLFPAGAVVVQNNKIVTSSLSSSWPAANHHSESLAVDKAMKKLNQQLGDCTLYASMESCLMCITKTYWAGSRNVYFALSKSMIGDHPYEGSYNTNSIVNTFHNKMNITHLTKHEDQALEVYNTWLSKQNMAA